MDGGVAQQQPVCINDVAAAVVEALQGTEPPRPLLVAVQLPRDVYGTSARPRAHGARDRERAHAPAGVTGEVRAEPGGH